jgi:uncharacterized membrane protein
VIFFGLLLLAVPFLLPVISFVGQSRLRRRIDALDEALGRQQASIDEIAGRLRELRKQTALPTATRAQRPATAAPTEPVSERIAPPPPPAEPVHAEPLAPLEMTPATEPLPADAARPLVETHVPIASSIDSPSSGDQQRSDDLRQAPLEAPGVPVPPLSTAAVEDAAPAAAAVRLDWEQLIGVRMFSAVAGIALVLAAVFFLRYSIDHGWLAPPVRVAIGILTGIALLVVCDLRAARRYPVTANALDAAAIAVLFSTFFSAHAMWHLIPAGVAFGLLALVTAVAVLLSIRRDSLFIAVLGLLGGFATPALLSTGENRPVPLFAYLLLLNVGLAWVANRKRWRVLTLLTLVLTTLYQWGWVIRFLTASQLSLAMGIFLIFALTAFVSLMFTPAAPTSESGSGIGGTGLAAAAMPLFFGVYLAAVPAYGAQPGLLFGFLLIVDAGLLAITIARREPLTHLIGGAAAMLCFAVWLALSYVPGAWMTATASVAAFVALFALAPFVAERVGRPLPTLAARAVYVAPLLLFVFPIVARIEPAAEAPLKVFAPLFALLMLLAWRALATGDFPIYYIAAFFGLAAEATWSATHLTADHLRAAFALYAAFGAYSFGVPLLARRRGIVMEPRWAGGAVLLASLCLLLFLAAGAHAPVALWGLAALLAIVNAGIFIESASGRLPALSIAGGALSWIVLAVWWGHAAATVGVLPSLLFVVLMTLTMLAGHAWAHRHTPDAGIAGVGFRHGSFLALLGHLFLLFTALDPRWSVPPWPLLGAVTVLTLALSATSLAVEAGALHAAGVIAAAAIVCAWSQAIRPMTAWSPVMIAAAEAVAADALVWLAGARRRGLTRAAGAATAALIIAEFTVVNGSGTLTAVPVAGIIAVHVVNVALVLAIAWQNQWPWVASATVIPAWMAAANWHVDHAARADWRSSGAMTVALYTVFVAYPFVLGRRARGSREPYLAAIAASALFFFAARAALLQGGFDLYVGAVPVVESAVLALLLRKLLGIESAGERDLGRLALVAGTALGFATVAIPLQLNHQWITIGWALEGAALAWTYRRIPHRGLLYWSVALLAVVFARLAFNPEVFGYEPRGYRVFNWYLYTYMTCAGTMFTAAWWFTATDDRPAEVLPRASTLLPAAGVILLFLLLNIEIADFYATGPAIAFRFGVTLAQDLTYTIGWLTFGLLLLTSGIYLHNRPGRIAAVALIAITACKAFLYDTGSLGGLYRVGSLVGLAISLSLVALALQKFVLHSPQDPA